MSINYVTDTLNNTFSTLKWKCCAVYSRDNYLTGNTKKWKVEREAKCIREVKSLRLDIWISLSLPKEYIIIKKKKTVLE